MERLSLDRLKKLMDTVYKVAREIDRHLITSHVGEYEAIFYYHSNIRDFPRGLGLPDQAARLKKRIGQYANSSGVQLVSKKYCSQLITYYENL